MLASSSNKGFIKFHFHNKNIWRYSSVTDTGRIQEVILIMQALILAGEQARIILVDAQMIVTNAAFIFF